MNDGTSRRTPDGAGRQAEAEPGSPYTIAECADAAAQVYGVAVEDMRGHSREKGVARARYLAILLTYEQGQHSYPEIGSFFGRGHSTAQRRESRAQELLTEDEGFQAQYRKAKLHLSSEPESIEETPDSDTQDHARTIIKQSIARGEIDPFEVLGHEAVGGLKLLEILSVVSFEGSPEGGSADEHLDELGRARLIMLQAGIREDRIIGEMSPVEEESLYQVLEDSGLLRQQ